MGFNAERLHIQYVYQNVNRAALLAQLLVVNRKLPFDQVTVVQANHGGQIISLYSIRNLLKGQKAPALRG